MPDEKLTQQTAEEHDDAASLIKSKNEQFQRMLASFLIPRVDDKRIIEKYSKFFSDITQDEITFAIKNQESLLGAVSNASSRVTRQIILDEPKGARNQLFWLRFREFAIDYIVNSGLQGVDKLFIDLGIMRHAFSLFVDEKDDSFLFRDELHRWRSNDWHLFGLSGFGSLHSNDHRDNDTQFKRYFGFTKEHYCEEIRLGSAVWGNIFEAVRVIFQALISIDEGTRGYINQCKIGEHVVFSKRDISDNKMLLSNIDSIIKTFPITISKILVDFDSMNSCHLSVMGFDEGDPAQYQVHKFFSAFPDSVNSSEPIFFPIGMVAGKENEVICKHPGLSNSDWSPLIMKLKNLFSDGNKDPAVFYQNLGEFSDLFINIAPFIRGSASICEWIMYGLAKYHGMNLGGFNKSILSWDIDAFFSLSPIEYGKKFSEFFEGDVHKAARNQSSGHEENDDGALKKMLKDVREDFERVKETREENMGEYCNSNWSDDYCPTSAAAARSAPFFKPPEPKNSKLSNQEDQEKPVVKK